MSKSHEGKYWRCLAAMAGVISGFGCILSLYIDALGHNMRAGLIAICSVLLSIISIVFYELGNRKKKESDAI